MPRPLSKRVIVVTGASRGLGREIALRFGREGDRIVVNVRSNRTAATAVADEIRRHGGEALVVQADVRSTVEVEVMMNETMKQWGAIDVLVNNAGMTQDGLMLRMHEQAWDDVVDTNLSGPFRCIRAAAKIMTRQRHGHIINIASIVGMQGREGQANYTASKAGLVGLTRAVAKELGRFNIKVNAVLPGYLSTDMGGEVQSAVHERILQENALGRMNEMSEIADFILHLSRMNNVSGQVFNLDSRIY